VGLNIAGILYYKYLEFFWHYLDMGTTSVFGVSIGNPLSVALPIGISFFTFQAISYLVDVYRGTATPARNYFSFAVYHTLFPQLVAGPIVRFREIGEDLYQRTLGLPQVTEGAYRFCLGLGKKIILADNLGLVADQLIQLPGNELTAGHAWLGIVCYTFQIYYDFSGYTDMAIGLGTMLGFTFPENFDQPYRASNITEFWRRWHMTLTRWFRDYLYIPMGGNRHGPVRTYVNLFTVFLLCGLWHGAGANFLIWGAYHGFFLVVERIADQRFHFRPRGLIGTMATLVVVMVGWVFFRIESLPAALDFIRTMFGFGRAEVFYFPVRYFLANDTLFYLAVATACAFVPAKGGYLRLATARKVLVRSLLPGS
jgi:alginate O-acetyltransferase complex protein AlgI